LREAVFALKDDPFFRAAMGEKFVDYYVFIKNAEIERFQSDRVGTARIF
jgi:glutamine synthetase